MKVMTVFGTRPEIIRLSRVVALLDEHCDQTLVHTGQNHDPALSDVFFRELRIRAPDVHLGVRGASFAEQAAQILQRTGELLERQRPDRLLILGDTNSGLAAIVAARLNIAVYHMEAGNRCYDDRVPEEINRRLIDHTSSVLLPYTQRSKDNLVREGIDRSRIFVTGNPILEVLKAYSAEIDASSALERLGLQPGEYLLATLHRAENVDEPRRLERLLQACGRVAETAGQPLIMSVHPRTADKIRRFGVGAGSELVRMIDPLGFPDFVRLEKSAACVLSDSGTVQEECAILAVPNVTLRDVTERPETLECGSNIITGDDEDTIVRAVELARHAGTDWTPPAEYMQPNVSRTVAKILLGYRHTAS